MLGGQIYSLLYRYTVIHDNPQVHVTFMSMKSKIFWISVQHAIATILALLCYFGVMKMKANANKVGREVFCENF
jgi:hypothetical protein